MAVMPGTGVFDPHLPSSEASCQQTTDVTSPLPSNCPRAMTSPRITPSDSGQTHPTTSFARAQQTFPLTKRTPDPMFPYTPPYTLTRGSRPLAQTPRWHTSSRQKQGAANSCMFLHATQALLRPLPPVSTPWKNASKALTSPLLYSISSPFDSLLATKFTVWLSSLDRRGQ
jgi:hypothetical protein